MSQRITFYTTLVQREKLDEWSVRETEKHIGSFVLAIPTVPLVNISRGFVAIVTLKTIHECCRVCNTPKVIFSCALIYVSMILLLH